MSITKILSRGISTLPAGSVLQVVTATDSTVRTTTSTSFVTGSNSLSVTITPSSASNKIFVSVSSTIGNTNSDGFCHTTIYRGATNLGETNGMGVSYGNNHFPLCLTVLDSPSSTSALTYQVYFMSDNVGKTAVLNRATVKGSITAFEIAG